MDFLLAGQWEMHAVHSSHVSLAFRLLVSPLSIPAHSSIRGIENGFQISVWCGRETDVVAQRRGAAVQTNCHAVYIKHKVRELL